MLRLGQTAGLNIQTKTFITGQFQLIRRRTLQSKDSPCREEEEEGGESYSFTRCLLQFVAGRAGCHLDWVGGHTETNYPTCRSLSQLKIYGDLLEEIAHYSWLRLTRESGCVRKCQYQQYNFVKVGLAFRLVKCWHPGLIQLREEPITWGGNYSSAFILMAEKTSVEEHEELLVFDIEDLINGIGGALGLFLGWSILYLGKNKI